MALRAEKIKALEDTGLAVLNKADYFKVLQKAEHKSVIDVSQLIRNALFFAKFDRASLRHFTEKSAEEHYTINNFVFKQGSEADYLYIVHSGEFEVLRCTSK